MLHVVNSTIARLAPAVLATLVVLGAQQLRLPAPVGYINDFADVIAVEDEARITRVIDEVRAKAGGEIVVVTLRSLEGRTVDEIALRIGRAAGCGYNRIQSLDEQAEAMRANIEAELIRRNDLIPNLVATVDEVAQFQQETFTRVAEARAGLTRARDQLAQAVGTGATPDEIGRANAAVSDNLRLFLNVAVEAYPNLTANQNFTQLQDELTETENRIAVARRDYNEAVQAYNTYIRQFPQMFTARVIGADRKMPFAAPESARQAPQVRFSRDTSGS
jgi:LemA protein